MQKNGMEQDGCRLGKTVYDPVIPRTEKWLRPQGEMYLITVGKSHTAGKACSFHEEQRRRGVLVPQSLSIRSSAANKSCSENRVPNFSTASSETMSLIAFFRVVE